MGRKEPGADPDPLTKQSLNSSSNIRLAVELPTRIYLAGFMGSGKSTLGPIVANVLGYGFLDLDAAIVRRAGKPIPQVFAEDGEPAFRRLEAEALRAMEKKSNVVVSVGGGALANEANMAWALAHGTVVYLHVPTPVLVRRLLRGRTERPLLLGEDGRRLSAEALTARVEGMLARREPFYRRAHITVEMGRRSIGQTVDDVVRVLKRYERNR